MKDETKKKIGIWVILLLLVIAMYFQTQTQKERREKVEREGLIQEENLPEKKGNLKEEDRQMLKQRQEEAQVRYFKDQADWAGIGEGEE